MKEKKEKKKERQKKAEAMKEKKEKKKERRRRRRRRRRRISDGALEDLMLPVGEPRYVVEWLASRASTGACEIEDIGILSWAEPNGQGAQVSCYACCTRRGTFSSCAPMQWRAYGPF